MNGGRIQSSDRSRVSLCIGVILGMALLAVVIYFTVIGHSLTKDTIGFDPNRPVPSDKVIRARLKPEQYHVVRENGTETAFKNTYWNKFDPGIYVDVITGEPLFSSLDKFDGQTGRPTFSRPISKDLLVEREDDSYDMKRIEIRAKRSDAHLGHLLQDPTSPTGQRYAVNSAALKFIPIADMDHQGYAAYKPLVTQVATK
jgi:methionine-R-sulfoxide reductase